MQFLREAELALNILLEQGFEDAHVSISETSLDELNIQHDRASLLRSNHGMQLKLTGLFDNRKSSTVVSECSENFIRQAATTLFKDVQTVPQDEANFVSAQQSLNVVKGPQSSDTTVLARTASELLRFRASESPQMHLNEALCSFTHVTRRDLTSRGSDLQTRIGHYEVAVFGVATDETRSSSFNYADGYCEDIGALPASEWFGIGDMMRQTQKQIHTQGIKAPFVGDVIFAPNAVASILEWLAGQLGDAQLIAGSSIYKDRVGEKIASDRLSIHSHFDGAGVCPISADAFHAKPFTLLENGSLKALLPSLYGSRKTGIAHTPHLVDKWSVSAGSDSVSKLISGVRKGALVSHLAMGMPGPNGDFSAVIKCSFLISDGEIGPALSEVMISGNMAELLRCVSGVSAERIDYGFSVLPWVRVDGLHFS